jgi:hypothetical protein
VREADNLPPYSAYVKKSRSLNSTRALWACMACNGCALPLPLLSSERYRTVPNVLSKTKPDAALEDSGYRTQRSNRNVAPVMINHFEMYS